jgi:hypothetical protein
MALRQAAAFFQKAFRRFRRRAKVKVGKPANSFSVAAMQFQLLTVQVLQL